MKKIIDCNYIFVIMAITFINFFDRMTNLKFFYFYILVRIRIFFGQIIVINELDVT